MKLKPLGTIFANERQLAEADRHSDKELSKALLAAEKELTGLDRRIVGGEVRYYKTPSIYTPAVVRAGVRRWFEVRADGDYSIKA